MDVLWFLILLFLLALIIGAWPTWPHTRTRWPYTRGGSWGYAPSAAAAALLVLLLLLVWFGLLAIWWPWAAAPPPA